MGDTIWLEVDDGQSAGESARDNSVMLKYGDKLDALADRLGVTKLSKFYDATAMADAYGEEFDVPDDAMPEEVWSDAADGLRTLTALVEELRRNPSEVTGPSRDGSIGRQSELLEDLDYCRARVADASEKGQKFRLLLVP